MPSVGVETPGKNLDVPACMPSSNSFPPSPGLPSISAGTLSGLAKRSAAKAKLRGSLKLNTAVVAAPNNNFRRENAMKY